MLSLHDLIISKYFKNGSGHCNEVLPSHETKKSFQFNVNFQKEINLIDGSPKNMPILPGIEHATLAYEAMAVTVGLSTLSSGNGLQSML